MTVQLPNALGGHIVGLPDVDESWVIKREHLQFKGEIGKGPSDSSHFVFRCPALISDTFLCIDEFIVMVVTARSSQMPSLASSTGAFGTVYKADYLGIDVAVKHISPPGGFVDKMEEIFAQREIAVLKSCRHPNIVSFIGASAIVTPDSWTGIVEQAPNSQGIEIVLEQLSKGDLGRYLLDSKEPVSWARRVKVLSSSP